MSDPTIVDSFLFSEPHEAELLLAKLHVESPAVTHWVAVENAYTIKGIWKGLFLRRLLDEDARFEPFRNRLTVVEVERAYAMEYEQPPRERLSMALRKAMRHASLRSYQERPFFHAEWAQRREAWPAVLEVSGGRGMVLVSDVDELVDFANDDRRRAVLRTVATGAKAVHLPRRRFVFDFDNLTLGGARQTPMARIDSIAAGEIDLGTLRVQPQGLLAGPDPIVIEYSYCYGVDGIARKLETFTHLDPGGDVLQVALECNHALVRPDPGRLSSAHWYETVDLTQAGHPAYIADRIDNLKTGVVNPAYRTARPLRYPSLFTRSA